MSAPALVLRDISKRFGALQALDKVELEVGASELLVLLGPTGAGKTTLLRIIAGLEQPDEGRVMIGGHDATSLAPAERDVALVFQNFSLYPDWSVRANLEFPLRAPGRNLTAGEIEGRVRWAADLLRIAALLDRPSRSLSGGEMQRVAIGRAIVRRPKLFLMDEPLSNLDAKLRESLRVELASLARELGTPMVYVTHDQADALSMGDRIAVLCGGRIQQIGAPREVYERPVSPIVARQLGTPQINLFDVRRGNGSWLATDGTPLAPASDGMHERAVLGVRPEHIGLCGGPRETVAEVVENTGPACIVTAQLGGCTLRILAPRTPTVAIGERITPRIDPERVSIWPEKS